MAGFNSIIREEAPPNQQGMIIALVGPDGVGKTAQTAQLTKLLQKNFRCTAVYLGSGEGGWRSRRIAARHLRTWRTGKANPGSSTKAAAAPRDYHSNHSLWTALSGVAIAVERYLALGRAIRLAASGAIVISDRWPQNIQPGMFDGPLRLEAGASPIVRLLSRIERHLYGRMQKRQPGLTVHLVSDFGTSNARKPGDRSRAQFDERLSLMQEMRARDPNIKIVDASKGFDQVTQELLKCVNSALPVQTAWQGRTGTSATAGASDYVIKRL